MQANFHELNFIFCKKSVRYATKLLKKFSKKLKTDLISVKIYFQGLCIALSKIQYHNMN